MNGIYQHYIIDLSSNNNFVQVPTVQGDGNNIRGFEVELIENGVPYVIDKTDCVIAIMGTKPDTKQIINECQLTDDGYILVDITSQMSAVNGRGNYQIVLMSKSTNSQLKSFPFYILTTSATFDVDQVVSSDEFTMMANTITRAEGAINDARDAILDVQELVSKVEGQESVRNSNEELRKSAEDDRNLAEVQRRSNETLRVSGENERIVSESSRLENELARNAAENERARTFGELTEDIEAGLTKLETANIESVEGVNSFVVKVTNRDGQLSTSPNLLNTLQIGTVETGDYDESPTVMITGGFGEQKLNFRIPTGKPFKISKTYPSITAMEDDSDGVNLYDFIMINTGNVEDEDNGKLYMKDVSGMAYITDLSGVQGIQGVKGDTGLTPNLTIGTVTTGNPNTQASATITGTPENPIINLVIPRGETGTFDNASASNIPFASEEDTNTIKDVVDGKLGKTEAASSANQLSSDTVIDGIKFNGTSNVNHYAICSSDASDAQKVVSLNGFSLSAGSTVKVKFTTTNEADNPTLNVNDTGAKPIHYHGSAIPAGYLIKNHTHEFVYNGVQYEIIGDMGIDNCATKSEVNDLKKSVADGKASVASAITAKGVLTAQDATFSELAENIAMISGNDGNNVTLAGHPLKTATGLGGVTVTTSFSITDGKKYLIIATGGETNLHNSYDSITVELVVGQEDQDKVGLPINSVVQTAPPYHGGMRISNMYYITDGSNQTVTCTTRAGTWNGSDGSEKYSQAAYAEILAFRLE